jgi:hypothetical protein
VISCKEVMGQADGRDDDRIVQMEVPAGWFE